MPENKIIKIRPLLTLKTAYGDIPEAWMRNIAKHVIVGAFAPCWIWAGPLDRHGYPMYRATEAITGKVRIVWVRTQICRMFWQFPKGYYVTSTCQAINCVNPSHLKICATHPGFYADRPEFDDHARRMKRTLRASNNHTRKSDDGG
jgi:hypothetical protein